ncbi:DUF2946 family protein [Glaciimonas sp. PCH181]|uniref:DUF2946 family protein n=1 Tax=Glaciimonas sp. PCH181 TaxID=2133943 RepID=UPI002105B50E|nr:DUF2946 family protein [Glaciimonas sp. PCH181]
MHYGAWIGIMVILMSAFAPMISQTLTARRFLSAHQTSFTDIIQAAPLCLFHDASDSDDAKKVAATTDTAMSGMAMMSSSKAMPMQHSKLSQPSSHSHEGHEGHDGQEACGYCNLFAHSPLLLNTLLQITSATLTHHAFIAAMGAAFRPYTVAAASRPQPPPLM